MRTLVFLIAVVGASAASPEKDIRNVLSAQEESWNRGDLVTFMNGYKNAVDITFMGKSVTRGFAPVFDRYRNNYSNRDKMGTLRFSELEVKALGSKYALVLGRFQLTRSAAGGGDASGRFTLIAERTREGWKFIHDHTS
jgi:ketosteroid isomerase-like protein